ncbi:LysR family transcriptional regulator [uncultured Alsobacter sp.]|uniref:LysR family transcriptional regulator n=1 Tax=uncultured Alsobacter sp. TaxID=1748258 RepID=UPI0025F439A5|nr:LysR family transcriptional regulator [uncultured Alsobacter sp.]
MPARRHTASGSLLDWDRLRIVLALEAGGSLSAAGRLLGVDHTTVARQLESLERDFGAPLFERGPRGFSATLLGEEVLTTARQMEDATEGLLRRLQGAAPGLSGTVRITTVPILANLFFAPALGDLRRRHPELQVELIGLDRSLDLSRREADLAVRLARPEMPGLLVRRLGEMAFAFYASTDDDRPFHAQHFLAYDDTGGSVTLQQFLADLADPGRIAMRSNSLQALMEAAAAGLGCALLPCFMADATGRLRRVPAPRHLAPVPLWLAYHEDLRRSPRVQAGASFISDVVVARRAALVPVGFPFDPG